MDNYADVLLQMAQFGIELQPRDLDKLQALQGSANEGKRKTCGKGGKDWFKLYVFRPDAGGAFITGAFGTYRHGGSWQKVEVDWKPLSDSERIRRQAERDAARAAADAARRAEVELAALGALELWRRAAPHGVSPYLERKGLRGESCRYLGDTLVVPMLRYDRPRSEALLAVQRVLPNGRKLYSKGFAKAGCAVRLGRVARAFGPILVCEGYATGLAIRLALEFEHPVFVAFDAGNLVHVLPLLHALYPDARLLICADDDWRTRDPQSGDLSNPGRTTARKVAKQVPHCDLVWPVFDPAVRQDKDTDFDDLRQRQGLDAVRAQLGGVMTMLGRLHG